MLSAQLSRFQLTLKQIPLDDAVAFDIAIGVGRFDFGGLGDRFWVFIHQGVVGFATETPNVVNIICIVLLVLK